VSSLLLREGVPFAGWTQEEIDQVDVFITQHWLKALTYFIDNNCLETNVTKEVNVLKTHLITNHWSDMLMSHGALKVSTFMTQRTSSGCPVVH
jgi:hypothetical protein